MEQPAAKKSKPENPIATISEIVESRYPKKIEVLISAVYTDKSKKRLEVFLSDSTAVIRGVAFGSDLVELFSPKLKVGSSVEIEHYSIKGVHPSIQSKVSQYVPIELHFNTTTAISNIESNSIYQPAPVLHFLPTNGKLNFIGKVHSIGSLMIRDFTTTNAEDNSTTVKKVPLFEVTARDASDQLIQISLWGPFAEEVSSNTEAVEDSFIIIKNGNLKSISPDIAIGVSNITTVSPSVKFTSKTDSIQTIHWNHLKVVVVPRQKDLKISTVSATEKKETISTDVQNQINDLQPLIHLIPKIHDQLNQFIQETKPILDQIQQQIADLQTELQTEVQTKKRKNKDK